MERIQEKANSHSLIQRSESEPIQSNVKFKLCKSSH